MMMLGRKRSASDDEGEPQPKRRYNAGGHIYEVRLLVQSQVRNASDLITLTLFGHSNATAKGLYFRVI